MARIIEIDDPVRDRDYNNPERYVGALLAVLVMIILIPLFLWNYGYGPWYVNATGVTNRAEGLSRPFSNVSYVTVDNLNLRVRPNYYSYVTYVLPRGTRVDILGESYQEPTEIYGLECAYKHSMVGSMGGSINDISRRRPIRSCRRRQASPEGSRPSQYLGT